MEKTFYIFYFLILSIYISPVSALPSNKSVHENYHHYFNSNIYDAYHAQQNLFSIEQLNQLPALKSEESEDILVVKTRAFIERLKTDTRAFSYSEKRSIHRAIEINLRRLNQLASKRDRHLVKTPARFKP